MAFSFSTIITPLHRRLSFFPFFSFFEEWKRDSIHALQFRIPNFVRIRNRNEDSDWIVASVIRNRIKESYYSFSIT
ncbi:hypothetical protein DLM75_16950 [Leptospira stimsonii]|uniref:Uncharacterized protein n=1 Tax=Leptospira stimsonii TaxID=2202203 RepID=A0A396Z104_9LEPT|nr:hypothetical protein DLM75_16950 [Leptospira stimsonii]